jgi:hypothetical protein
MEYDVHVQRYAELATAVAQAQHHIKKIKPCKSNFRSAVE